MGSEDAPVGFISADAEIMANSGNGKFAVTVKNSFLNIIEDEEPLVEVPERLTQSCCLEKPSMSDMFSSRKFSIMTTSTNESLEMASLSSFFLQSCSQLELEAEDEAMPVYKPTAHECGECNPCAFAIKAGGCTKADCCHCHEDHSREYFKFSQKQIVPNAWQ